MKGFKMRYAQMPLAVARSTDDLAMIEANEVLTKAGIDVRRPPHNIHQL